MLIDRFDGRAAFSETAPTPRAKINLRGASHAELVRLADEIMVNKSNYNGQAKTFGNAMKDGIINSKSDIIKSLKAARAAIAAKYPQLSIETISVLIRGGAFDLKPDLPVKSDLRVRK